MVWGEVWVSEARSGHMTVLEPRINCCTVLRMYYNRLIILSMILFEAALSVNQFVFVLVRSMLPS